MKDTNRTDKMITATEIGKIIGKSAREVNLILLKKNVIMKVDNTYLLTYAGEEYGHYYCFESGGIKTFRNIKYHDSILNLVLSTKVLEPDNEFETNEVSKPDKECDSGEVLKRYEVFDSDEDYEDYEDLPF